MHNTVTHKIYIVPMKNNKKYPLTDKPLRNPGQSLDEEIKSLLNDDAMIYRVGSTFMVLFTALEFIQKR